MIVFTSFVMVAVSSPCLTKMDTFTKGQFALVDFPGIGKVQVTAQVESHRLPTLISKNAAGVQLLRFRIRGTDSKSKHLSIYEPFVIVRFQVLHPEGLGSPLIFAATKTGGASDCSYVGALVGELNGKLAELTPPLPEVSTDGGYAVAYSKERGQLTLYVWTMVWSSNESHYGPHSHIVSEYGLSSGRFSLSRRYVVRKNQRVIEFENILFELPDFGC